MKQVIDEILLEEKQARERVEAAREEAKQIRLKSDQESRKILDQSRQETQEEVKALLEKTRSEAEKEREAILNKAKKAGDTLWQEKAERIDKTLKRLFQLAIKKSDKA
jgi:V/A-type H+-transporting ATPase subunit G/H